MTEENKDIDAPESAITTLSGGQEITVTMRDGTDKTVFVKRVPYLKSEQLGRAWGDPLAELKLYTGWEKEELEELTDESAIRLHKEGRDLNFFILKAYQDELSRTTEGLGGGNQELVKELMREMAEKEMEKRS